MKKIIILGGGGTAHNVIDLLLNEQTEYYPIGFLDKKKCKNILGIKYLGKDKILSKIKKEMQIDYAFPAIGYGKNINNRLRLDIFKKLKKFNFKIPNIISNKAFIRSNVKMGEGNLIQAGSVIDTGVVLGSNISIGINNAIGHKTIIKDHVTITGSVNLAGNLTIGEGSFLGMNCTVFRNIGKWCKISAGVSCLEQVSNFSIVLNPKAKVIKF
tara:strand:- start:395 stop:1033 length:639 start_codon:yes stop_codon:yes gene_type:complete